MEYNGKRRKTSKALVSLLLAVLTVLTAVINVGAAGSIDYNVSPNKNRLYVEWGNDAYTAGIFRQQVTHVYMKAGETSYFGSSVYDSYLDENSVLKGAPTGSDIVIIDPSGKKTSLDVIKNGVGHISNNTKEIAGPNIDGTNTNGYTPLVYTPTIDGIYEVHFQSRTGKLSGSKLTPTKVNAPFTEGTTAYIAAWEVKVYDGNVEKPGRTYARYLSLSSGNNNITSDMMVYVLTNDGYVYKVELNDIDPWGFNFFANNRGLIENVENGQSIYHSVGVDANNMANMQSKCRVDYRSPMSSDTELEYTYKIFFEEPSKDLLGVLYEQPEEPQPAQNLKFFGSLQDLQDQVEVSQSFVGQGGYFQFDIVSGSSIEIVMVFPGMDGNPAYTVTLRSAVKHGTNIVYWDGRADDGSIIPAGIYDIKKIKIQTKVKAGEIHFPMFDVESLQDVTITRIKDPSTNGNYTHVANVSNSTIYYNNLPLRSDIIHFGQTATPSSEYSGFYALADGTNTYGQYKGVGCYNSRESSETVPTGRYYALDGVDSRGEADHSSAVYADTVANGVTSGGNMAAIDIWTYYVGPHSVSSSYLENKVIIVDRPTEPPTGQTEPTAPTVPTEPTSPTGPTVPTEPPTGPTSPTTPTGPTSPTTPTEPTSPTTPTEPTSPTTPTGPTSPTTPTGPTSPTSPTTPTGPTSPTTPTGPTAPTIPTEPTAPTIPTEPTAPTIPTEPTEPPTQPPTLPIEKVYDVEGLVFYDYDNNSEYMTSKGDHGMNDVTVTLYQEQNGKYVEIKTMLTNGFGYYKFYNLPAGKYKVATNVNDSMYTLTTSKKGGTDPQIFTVSETNNQIKAIGYYIPPAEKEKDMLLSKTWKKGEADENKVMIEMHGYLFSKSVTTYSESTALKENDKIVDILVKTQILDSYDNWKYNFNQLTKHYIYDGEEYVIKYFVEEYYFNEQDEPVFIGKSDLLGVGTPNVMTDVNGHKYDSRFSWSMLSDTEIQVDVVNLANFYKVIFHSNLDSDKLENLTGTYEDVYKVYGKERYEQMLPEIDGNYLESDDTINVFEDIPELSYKDNNQYIFAGWYYDEDNDNDENPLKWDDDKYSEKADFENYHIYAHWVPIGTVAKEDDGKSIEGVSEYSGFGLIGTQIRDDGTLESIVDDLTFKDEKYGGLRYFTSYSEWLLSTLDGLFTTSYTSSGVKGGTTYNHRNYKYGYVVGIANTVRNYANQNPNYKMIIGANGVKEYECTRDVATKQDHRECTNYRLSSFVMTYPSNNNKATDLDGRAYLGYTDSNGLYRYAYNNYEGSSAEGMLCGGCVTSYSKTLGYVKQRIAG